MKVDTKIVPIEVKEGWFKKKQKYQLQWVITLTEVEKAIINKAGLRDFSYYQQEYTSPDGSYHHVQPFPIYPWIDGTVPGFGHGEYDTLIEAQAVAQRIKAGLVKLKEAMEIHTSNPTEDSFEL